MAFIGSGYVDDVACVAKYRVAMNIWASNHPWVHTTISACQCYRLCSEKKNKKSCPNRVPSDVHVSGLPCRTILSGKYCP